MKLDMDHEPIVLPRVVVTLLATALAVIARKGQRVPWVAAVAAAGIAWIGDGVQQRAFTDSPATQERRLAESAAELDAMR